MMKYRNPTTFGSVHMIVAGLMSLLIAAAGGCVDQQDRLPGGLRADQGTPHDSALTPSADAELKLSPANSNFGSNTTIVIQAGSPRRRMVVRFDSAQIASAIGIDSLASATLEVTITSNGGGWASGSLLGLYTLNSSWTEGSVTWNCPSDANLSNSTADCSPQWDQQTNGAFSSTASATASIANGQTGTISFTVTSDIRQWLTGGNKGWVLKRSTDGELPGSVTLGAREGSSNKPRLVLSIIPGDTSRPALPSSSGLPRDSNGVALVSRDTTLILFRNYAGITFDDSTSGVTIRSILAKYSATIVGGNPYVKQYIVRVLSITSLAGLDSLILAIQGEAGVAYANPMAWKQHIEINSRYPSDTGGRQTWFAAPGNYSRSRIQIRLPLAWGCETGAYGSHRARVGVVDFYFSPMSKDLVTSVIAPPNDSLFTAPSAPTALELHHGTAVAGVIGARGDNDTAISGVLWKSRLFGLSLTRNGRDIGDFADYLPRILKLAQDSGVKVINISLAVPMVDAHGLLLPKMISAMRAFIQNGGFLVLSVGNGSDISRTVSDVASSPSANPTQQFNSLLVAAARIATTADSGGVIVVAATNADGTGRWTNGLGSDFVSGLSVLAAPGESILSLANDSGGLTAANYSGTSFAAPFVAGAAALLWEFDSTLTPAQVRSYLLRGADAQRLSPSTGQLVSPTSLSGLGSVHMLDVYSSLRLVSQERSGTPVCGYPVRISNNGDSILLDSPGASRREYSISGAEGIGYLSVAQGGRLISVGITPSVNTSILTDVEINHQGAEQARANNVLREYLESDTVVYDASNLSLEESHWPFTVKRAKGQPVQMNSLVDLFAPSGYVAYSSFAQVSPAGDSVLVVADFADTAAIGTDHFKIGLAGIGGGIRVISDLTDEYDSRPMGAWGHDGRFAAVWTHYQPTFGNLLSAYVLTGSENSSNTTTAFVNGFYGAGARFSSEDAILYTSTTDTIPFNSSCYVFPRPVDNLSSPVQNYVSGQFSDCPGSNILPPARQQNLRASRTSQTLISSRLLAMPIAVLRKRAGMR
jgi:hypothetical protein